MKLFVMIIGAAIIYWLHDLLYRKFWDKDLSIRIHFQEKPVLEGETAELTEVIENRKLLPLSYLNVKFKISRNLVFSNMENTSTSDWNYKNDIFSILFHQRITRVLPFRCEKRGYYTIDQADAISSNLLMTGSLVKAMPQHSWLYVYPKEISIAQLDVPFRKMIGSQTARRFLYEDPFEFRGLRDYARSDPMNSINWKASARTGKLTVNVHDSTTSQEAIVFLNLEDETVWKYDLLHETAIRIASALCYRFLKESVPVRILCNGKDCISGSTLVLPAGSGLRQVNAINEILARIDLKLSPIPCINLVNEVISEKIHTNPLFVMIGNCMRDDLQQAFNHLCALSGSGLWVVPLHNDMELHVSKTDYVDVVRWEVDYYDN